MLAAIEPERVIVFPAGAVRLPDPGRDPPGRPCRHRVAAAGFTAGAPLARQTFDLFGERFGLPLRQLYGCSEAGSVTINLDDDADAHRRLGRPAHEGHRPGRRGRGRRAARPRRDAARSCFSSPAATTGYVGVEPEANGRSFAGGWFRTGDLGHLDGAGNLYVTGRTKLFISTSGYKVDPFEVEDVLRRHPAVADVVVVGAAGALGEEVVKAVVVQRRRRPDDRQLRHELLALCREELAVYKVPRIVEFRDEIPRSPLGKILRKYLVWSPMADVVDLPALLDRIQGFPPLQRVLLATAGTLQGTLSAYFGAPVTVEVVSQTVEGEAMHREVDLVCKERDLVACSADDRGPRSTTPACAS